MFHIEEFSPKTGTEIQDLNTIPEYTQKLQEELGFRFLGYIKLTGENSVNVHSVFGNTEKNVLASTYNHMRGVKFIRKVYPQTEFHTLFKDGTLLETTNNTLYKQFPDKRAGYFVQHFPNSDPAYLYQKHLERLKKESLYQQPVLHDSVQLKKIIDKHLTFLHTSHLISAAIPMTIICGVFAVISLKYSLNSLVSFGLMILYLLVEFYFGIARRTGILFSFRNKKTFAELEKDYGSDSEESNPSYLAENPELLKTSPQQKSSQLKPLNTLPELVAKLEKELEFKNIGILDGNEVLDPYFGRELQRDFRYEFWVNPTHQVSCLLYSKKKPKEPSSSSAPEIHFYTLTEEGNLFLTQPKKFYNGVSDSKVGFFLQTVFSKDPVVLYQKHVNWVFQKTASQKIPPQNDLALQKTIRHRLNEIQINQHKSSISQPFLFPFIVGTFWILEKVVQAPSWIVNLTCVFLLLINFPLALSNRFHNLFKKKAKKTLEELKKEVTET